MTSSPHHAPYAARPARTPARALALALAFCAGACLRPDPPSPDARDPDPRDQGSRDGATSPLGPDAAPHGLDAARSVDVDAASRTDGMTTGSGEDAASPTPGGDDAGRDASADAASPLDAGTSTADAATDGGSDVAADAGAACAARDTDAPPRPASFPARLAGQDAWIHDERSSAGYFHTYDALNLGGDTRRVHVFLPRSYPGGCATYPVVYMHDGNAVFFPGPVGKTWDVQRVLEQAYAAQQLREVIVVAVHPIDRDREYTHVPWLPGRACCDLPRYTDYLADALKPFVDGAYRTERGPAQTVIVGSSHGGLAAFYAATVRGDVFGRAIAMSSSFWVGLDALTVGGPLSSSALMQAAGPGLASRPRLYLDWGLVRSGGTHNSLIEARATTRGREMADLLRQSHAYTPGVDLLTVEDPRGEHDEDSWHRRLGPALSFILGP
jgi:predicted alpha/beta superfamily hydrolase